MLAAAVLAVAVAAGAGHGRALPGDGHALTYDGDQAQQTRTVSVRQTWSISLAPQQSQMEQCNWGLPMTTMTHEPRDDAMTHHDDDATHRIDDDAIHRRRNHSQ